MRVGELDFLIWQDFLGFCREEGMGQDAAQQDAAQHGAAFAGAKFPTDTKSAITTRAKARNLIVLIKGCPFTLTDPRDIVNGLTKGTRIVY